MERTKRERLAAKGWKVGTTREFLGLSSDESRHIELQLPQGKYPLRRRDSRKLTNV